MKAIHTKGAITVFLSIVLSSVFLVVGVFSDAARIRLAHSQVQRAGKSAISSVLACYNNQLKDQYGLFGVYLDNDTMSDSFTGYFTKNLNMGDYDFLYDYAIEDMELKQVFNLENREVFEGQLMEFMKYRAPYELAEDLLAKIDGIKNISSGAKVYQRKIETDRRAGEIGGRQTDLRDKANEINHRNIISDIAGQRNAYMSESSRASSCAGRLSNLQKLYSNEKDEKEKEKLLKEMNSVGSELSNANSAKNSIKNNIVNSLQQYKSLNFQALEKADAITTQKGELLDRIEEELQYVKDHQEGIRELQEAYEKNLKDMKKIISEDNSQMVSNSLKRNLSTCDGILNKGGSDSEFMASIEDLVKTENIQYTFNMPVPSSSNDEDNREKVKQALKNVFTEKPKTKVIENALLAGLPSRKALYEEEETKNWLNTDFESAGNMEKELDYLSSRESRLGELASDIAEELYTNAYIMGTFKHDVPLLDGEEESAAYNLRSEAKTERDGYLSCFEVEYIINGNKDEAVNSVLVKSEIMAIRLISNVIHIYTDASKMSRVSSLAAALGSLSAGLAVPLIQTMLVFSWAMLESVYDLEQLSQGKKILLFKTKEQWKTDLSGAIDPKKTVNAENNPFCLSYQDYLKIFLLLMDKDKKLARTQDLVQLNMGVSCQGFLLGACSAALEAGAAVSVRNIFVTLPELKARSYINEKFFTGY